MDLDDYQAAILVTLFERTAIADPIDSLRFALSGDFRGEFVVVGGPIRDSDEIIALNLPTYSTSVFVATTQVDLKAVALIIANLEDYERENGVRLGLGEAIVIPDDSPTSNAPYAVLLLRTSSLPAVANVPDTDIIAGRVTSFFLAVPLTEAEYEFKREHGHDKLLDRFEAEDKSVAF